MGNNGDRGGTQARLGRGPTGPAPRRAGARSGTPTPIIG